MISFPGQLDGRAHGQINMVSPVNWLNALNSGLVGWWLSVPGLTGGKLWPDLTGPMGNAGTLTGPTFTAARGRPGGYGALSFDGTDDSWATPTPKPILHTVSFWYFVPSSFSGNPIVLVQGGDAFNSAVWDWGIYHSSTNLVVHYLAGASITVSVSAYSGKWVHFTLNRKEPTDSMARVYLNGELAGTAGVSTGTLTGANPIRTLTGAQRAVSLYDSIRVYDRTVLPRAIYNSSIRFNEGLLNRIGGRAFDVAAAGGSSILLKMLQY